MCEKIDSQIPDELCAIQIDPAHLPIIRAYYKHDLADKLGLVRPDERKLMTDALTAIDQEETRMARMLASGKNQRSGLERIVGGMAGAAQSAALKLR